MFGCLLILENSISSRPGSFAELPPDQKDAHAAWETPFPAYWTNHGYVVVRADEVVTVQPPGMMDVWPKITQHIL
jgi:hypothetical protein